MWEQRKLGEVIREISTGKSVNSNDGIVRADDIGVLKTSCVSYDHFDPSESKPVVKNEQQLVKCVVEEDSVIVSRMNTPERVGACGYVAKSFPNLFLPDRLWKLKFQENIDAYFIYTMLVSSIYKEKIISMASGTSGSMYNIPKDTFLNLPLTLSLNIDEQTKIGNYFKELDHLITLHQCKYNADEKIGSFAWEQRKVGEVTKELSEYDNLASGLPLLTSSRNGLMYQSDYRGNVTTENENTLFSVVPVNACTYRHMSDDSTFHLNINTLEKGLVSREYPVFQETKSNLKFIVQYINSSNTFTKFCTEQKKGGTRTRLYYKTLCEYQLMIPPIKEQDKIADFFDGLDRLITLHQHKCEELKNIKKFMLQNMFVQEK